MNELGELRPSQIIFTFGVGSLVDLPNMSAMVMGLDDWDTRYCKELEEDRLVAAVQKRLGSQMSKLYLPPIKLDSADRDPAAPAIGVPVVPFPRWMRCSLCDTLSTVESGVFKLIQDPWRPDKTAYVHQGCLKSQGGTPPSAHSVRFLLACREGHLTDFPWLNFVHKGNVPCRPATLSMREFGASGDASDIHLMIGRRPNASFGNSTGDQQMSEYTGAGGGARLAMLVLHDGATREYAYGPAQGLP